MISFGNTSSAFDLLDGVSMAAGVTPDQLRLAARLAARFSRRYGENIAFTGHSLGGALASYAALSVGGSATTFGAYGLSPRIIESFDQGAAQITNFVGAGDQIRFVNNLLGRELPRTTVVIHELDSHGRKEYRRILQCTY